MAGIVPQIRAEDLRKEERIMDRTREKRFERRALLRYALRAILFLLLVSLVLSALTNLLREKSGDRYLLLSKEFADETEWDVIFAGCSRTNTSMYPMQLWEEYGFTSYNNAQSGETVPLSYWTCKSIIRRCHPKVLVLDVALCYLNRTYGNTSWMHQSLDPLSPNDRIPAALDVAPDEELMDFVFPLSIYHTRWKELTSADFSESDVLRRGCSQVFQIAEDIAGMETGELPEEETLPPADVVVEYLDKIIKLCEETGTQLVIFFPPAFTFPEVAEVKPTHDMTLEPLYANWLEAYTAEKGVGYVNFYKLIDELGFDYFRHMYNYSHMNYLGGEIITNYMGQYLTENYDLPDRRQDPAYENWNEDLELYRSLIAKQLGNFKGLKDTQTPQYDLKEIGLPDLPVRDMITREEYGDWVGNQGVWLAHVNGESVQNATELTVSADTQEIVFSGWMVDFWNDAPMQEVYLQVGSKALKCEYGMETNTVVERFGIEKMRKSCFRITVPVSLLQSEDIREVAFIGVSADGQYVYTPVRYQIDIA